jgi:hypothetical protein
MKVADGERYGVPGRWQEVAAHAHKVMGEGHLCVETEAEAMTTASATENPAAASTSESRCAGVSVIVVARYRYRGRIKCLRYIN